MYMGIDFGTCYSNVAVCEKNGSVYIIPRDMRGLLGKGEPTMMRYDETSEELLFGEECKNSYANFIADTIVGLKTIIRSNNCEDDILDTEVTTGGKKYSYRSLLEQYLCELIKKVICDNADKFSIDNIEGITVTVPCALSANSRTGTDYRKVVRESVAKAYEDAITTGVRLPTDRSIDVTVREEPVAAAIAYMKERGQAGIDQNILVVDLGGGTFDVTVVEYRQKQDGKYYYYVKEKEGLLDLGGNDWDETLLKEIERLEGIAYSSITEKRNNERTINLMTACDCKELLSIKDKVTFVSQSDTQKVSIERKKFEEWTKVLLQRAMDIVKSVVDKYGGISKIDKIVMVGGACKMPQVKRGISELFKDFEEKNIEPFECSTAIAMGAAYCAAMKDDINVVFEDVAAASYGFLTHRNGEAAQSMYNFIKKGEVIKSGEIKRDVGSYSAHKETQEAFSFRIYESDPEDYKKYSIEYGEYIKNAEQLEAFDKIFNKRGLEFEVKIPQEYIPKDKPINEWRASDFHVSVDVILDSNNIIKMNIWEYKDGKRVQQLKCEKETYIENGKKCTRYIYSRKEENPEDE